MSDVLALLPHIGDVDMTLNLQPVTLKEAQSFVGQHHRHHKAPHGCKFCIGLNDGEKVIGVIVVGRPVARHNDDGWTAEVTRLCVLDGYKNACSKLYSAAWRAARAMGHRRMITYILASESGGSLIASGWKELYTTKGDTWNRPGRPRVDKAPACPKTLFEVAK